MSRKEPKTLRVACFEGGRRKIITFKRGAYWWSPSEGAYPLLSYDFGSSRCMMGAITLIAQIGVIAGDGSYPSGS
ncbi:DUF6330 family protein [Roseivivax sp. CAU 1753]